MVRRIAFFIFLLTFGIGGERVEGAKTESPSPSSKSDSDKESPAASVSTSSDSAAASIQRDLEGILRIHRALETQHRDQILEIQRITEQARIHQQILRNLEIAQRAQKVQQAASIDEAVRRQKLLLIREKTRQNRAFLEGLGPGSSSPPERSLPPSGEKRKKNFG